MNVTTFPDHDASANAADPVTIFERLLSAENIREVFEERIAPSPLRGIDRAGPERFRRELRREIEIIQDKCLEGSYRFTPYLEALKLKGRGKKPRVLGVATLRDRIVLHLLKELLHATFSECVPRRLPNQYIREIRDADLGRDHFAVVRGDIKSFYDELEHVRLLRYLETRISGHLLRLFERAIRNPVVSPRDHTASVGRLRALSKGVPQGLSISNILAEIYVQHLDRTLGPTVQRYYRYVDDILLFTEAGTEDSRYSQMAEALASLGLELNDEKRISGPACMPFDYLGYRLSLPTVSVKYANVRRLIDSLAAHFSRYRHRKDSRYAQTWLDDAARQELFLEELNERITGAVSENRRYGWLFYFIEINDQGLLHRLDHIVQGLWQRVIGPTIPPQLKRFARAYHEARCNQLGGYIQNYNAYSTLEAKLGLLVKRGYLDPDSEARYTAEKVDQLFREVMYRSLARLEADVGVIS